MKGCEGMSEQLIFKMFLKTITEYEYLDFTEEELQEEFKEILAMALVEAQLQGVAEDITYSEEDGFSEELKPQEAYILAYSCVLIWVTPKVNSSEMLAYALTSTDFTLFSPANRLQACMKLKTDAQTKLNNLIADYDTRDAYKGLRKFLEEAENK